MKSFRHFLTEDDTARAEHLIGRNIENKMLYRRACERGMGSQFLDTLEVKSATYEKVKATWKANYHIFQHGGPYNITTLEGMAQARGAWVKAWKRAFPMLTEKQILRAVGENVENAFDAWDMLTDYINRKS